MPFLPELAGGEGQESGVKGPSQTAYSLACVRVIADHSGVGDFWQCWRDRALGSAVRRSTRPSCTHLVSRTAGPATLWSPRNWPSTATRTWRVLRASGSAGARFQT